MKALMMGNEVKQWMDLNLRMIILLQNWLTIRALETTNLAMTSWLSHSLLTSSVQSLSRVRLFAIPLTAASQASLSIINSRSLLKLTSIESVMPSNHLILCCPLLLPPSIFPRIRVFFQWVSSLHQVAKVLELQHQYFQLIFRVDFL